MKRRWRRRINGAWKERTAGTLYRHTLEGRKRRRPDTGRLTFTAEKRKKFFPDIYVLGGITSTVLEEAARDNLFRIRRDGQFTYPTGWRMSSPILRTARGLAVLQAVPMRDLKLPGEGKDILSRRILLFLLAGMHLRGCREEQVNVLSLMA